jgi:peptidyl-prolyl cis-trans isomerase D
MKNAFAGKISYFILTFIFLIIVASFLFSNFSNFSMGTGSNVGTVDGTPITRKEYQTALARQVEFFNQMMGGQTLSQKQLEEMGIKQSVLSGLVQQKLVINSANNMGMSVSLDEIKNEIRTMPYFKTNERFDVNLYRNALQANGYTPPQFEELVGNDLKQKKVDELFSSTLLSSKYVEDVINFKNSSVVILGVKVGRQSLSPLVSVSEQEIKDYLAKPENNKELEAAYTENISKYNKPAEVKARHILITGEDAKALEQIKALKAKINTKNFSSIASKETQDPKANGGDLGWFSAGRMVPEFEKVAFGMNKGEISEPVKTQFGYHLIYVEDKKSEEVKTLESVKKELAQLAVQKTKAQDLDKLLKTEEATFMKALQNNDLAMIEGTAKAVAGEVFKNTEVNRFDQAIGTHNLAPQEADQIFKAAPGTIVNLGNPGTIYLVKVVSKKEASAAQTSPEAVTKELTAQNQAFSRKVREELIKKLNNKAKVVTNEGML